MERQSSVFVTGHFIVSAAILWIAIAVGMTWAQPANTILLERWDGISGDTVPNLTGNANYPDNPAVRSYPTLYEIPTNTADNYGTRTRGYVTPPSSGNYTFWIAGDDHCELWLGTSSDPASARRIAFVPDWTNSREWTKYTQQQSTPIALTAGTRYYIETRHKEGTGGDNMAVGWQGPGITGDAERPIPGSRLAPFVLTAPAAKTLLLERWDGITGTTVTSLTSSPNYPNNPTSRIYPTLFEMAGATGDNYGTRTRGYITPPTTGNYTFWIASDDNSELWLGTNDNPSTLRLIASVPEWTNSREWTKYTQQQSTPIALTAGARYFIETRHKEGTGGDNLAVGWQGPGISGDAERPIPGIRLSPPAANEPPAITTQPANQTVGLGQSATFNVIATGTAPLSYQWRRNGANIVGATSSSYTTPAVTSADSGALFSVTVSNALGAVTSNNAVLTVAIPPTITLQPAHQTVNRGQPASFSVIATGTAPLLYQWRRNGSDIPGATLSSYTISSTVASDDGAQFTVQISNGAGSVLSSPVLLTVHVPPEIITHPVSQTVNAGQTATFSVTATGTRLNYSWRLDGMPILGSPNSPTYTTPPATASMNNGLYSCYVTNFAGAQMSFSARLTVNVGPEIVTQPANRAVELGQTATFSVSVVGTAPLVYQWRKNGENISGATFQNYTTPPATADDNGAQFSVVVSNAFGSVISSNALLTVGLTPTIITQPASRSVVLGQTASFTVVATGSAPLTYQWRRNATPITGATSASYTTPPATAADNGALYSVVVSNSRGTVTSNNATLTVISPPVITTQPANRTVNAGQTALFSVTATGTAPLTYQWRKNGTDISGATTASYTTPPTVEADHGALFSVVVSNSVGTVTSSNATLNVVMVTPNSRKLAVSGELVDAAGNPLGYPTPVTVDVVITLFDAVTAGVSRYTEEFRAAAGKGIRVENGLFVARLGEGTTSQNLSQVLAANPNLWAQITIDDGSPDVLSPRTPITAAAFALGGTTAVSAMPTTLSGAGDPNVLGVGADVGSSYVNTLDNSTWYKLSAAWKRMD